MAPVPWALVLVPLAALLGGAPGGAPAYEPSYEIDVADVSNAPDACPSQDQLAEALGARMPGVVAPRAAPGNPTAVAPLNPLHLSVTLTPEGAARITMTDATGALRLERDLELPGSAATPSAPARPPRERGAACATFAETIALIVERYMRHIGYHEPPPPALVEASPPPPAPPPLPRRGARLGLGASARPPHGRPWQLEPELSAGLRLEHLDVSASFAFGLPVDESIPMSSGTGTFRLWSLPFRLAVGWALPFGAHASLTPAVAGGADIVFGGTRGIGQTRQSSALEPTIEAGATARMALTRRVWIDLHAFQGIDLRPEEFSVNTASSGTVTLLMTPRTYTRIGLNFGVFLGKNRPLP
jgi:hypothetical protein